MSDYERINANVKTNVADRRHEAIKRIVVELFKVLLALGAIIGLKAIGFISESFMVILMAVAVCVGTFKTGYISRDIKY
jgi:uncharacterized membrane protein YheB (UPF0754 family)